MSIFDIFDKLNASGTGSAPTGPVEYIIAGLGNPGTQYEDTRHNAGFMTVDTLAEKYRFDIKKLRFKSLTGDVMIEGKHCLVMKPSTYMNNSGQAVVEALNFYKLPPERVIVCFDDITLAPSHIRIRRKGSDGGHNGMKSIIYLTGSDNIPRIKIGIGDRPNREYDLADWVLSRFANDELPLIHEAADNACEAIAMIVGGRINDAMNRFNNTGSAKKGKKPADGGDTEKN